MEIYHIILLIGGRKINGRVVVCTLYDGNITLSVVEIYCDDYLFYSSCDLYNFRRYTVLRGDVDGEINKEIRQ